MLRKTFASCFVAGVLVAATGFAQTPSVAPAGSTGVCKDGSYWTVATKQGACRGHKGVKDWYATGGSPSAAAPPTVHAAPATTPVAASKPAPVGAMVVKSAPTTASGAAGGGQVWVNKTSKVFHCSGDRWYGKTKDGAYMSQADAMAQGYHPDHGKACP